MSIIFNGLFGSKVGHKALFDEICRFHSFDKTTKVLLNQIIQKYQPLRPAEMFFNPTLLQHALADPDFSEVADDLTKLLDFWFAAK